MLREFYKIRGEGGIKLRLQRSVENIQRVKSKKNTGRKLDEVDLELLEKV